MFARSLLAGADASGAWAAPGTSHFRLKPRLRLHLAGAAASARRLSRAQADEAACFGNERADSIDSFVLSSAVRRRRTHDAADDERVAQRRLLLLLRSICKCCSAWVFRFTDRFFAARSLRGLLAAAAAQEERASRGHCALRAGRNGCAPRMENPFGGTQQLADGR